MEAVRFADGGARTTLPISRIAIVGDDIGDALERTTVCSAGTRGTSTSTGPGRSTTSACASKPAKYAMIGAEAVGLKPMRIYRGG